MKGCEIIKKGFLALQLPTTSNFLKNLMTGYSDISGLEEKRGALKMFMEAAGDWGKKT